MKKKYTFLLLLFSLVTLAQAPANYYNTATGTGYTLKTQLKNIITNGHSDQGYNTLWTLYTNTAFRDNYYENDSSLLDLYSENPTGVDPYNYTSTTNQCGNYNAEGQCYNREHLVPQSYFDEYQTNPMKNDPFHVFPSDGKVNGDRNNLGFGIVGTANYTSLNGSKRGSMASTPYSNYTGVVFEPIDAFKGDVARAYFYFATRYEDSMDNFYSAANSTTCQAKAMFDGSTNKVFSDDFILILIKWHLDDPVSAYEIAKNNAIYNYQGNRNPYIDNPSYVCSIWSTQCATVNSLNTANTEALSSIIIHPNPSDNHQIKINYENTIDQIHLININGQIIQQINQPVSLDKTYVIDNIPSGFYFLRITKNNQSVTKKVIVN
ncbi:endonuclease [Flavobacterium sp.]|uniref:endonuclease n=1 Tax=Flavobacterium sp. TaxID=239 RepID=UPI0026056073|nr:endonuclease [Flavobacterium sp.]MDD3003512.1 endonuclease [Flavobacterium sp.]